MSKWHLFSFSYLEETAVPIVYGRKLRLTNVEVALLASGGPRMRVLGLCDWDLKLFLPSLGGSRAFLDLSSSPGDSRRQRGHSIPVGCMEECCIVTTEK